VAAVTRNVPVISDSNVAALLRCGRIFNDDFITVLLLRISKFVQHLLKLRARKIIAPFFRS